MQSMMLILLSILLASAGVPDRGSGQDRGCRRHLPPQDFEAPAAIPEALPHLPRIHSVDPLRGDTIGWTDYDYGWSMGSLTMVEPYFPGAVSGTRAQLAYNGRNSALPGVQSRMGHVYVYFNGSEYISAPAVPRDWMATAGGDIGVYRGGSADGYAELTNRLGWWAINTAPGSTTFGVTQIPMPRPGAGVADPVSGIQAGTDNCFVFTSGAERDDIWGFKTSDFGVRWLFLDSLRHLLPSGTPWETGLNPPVHVRNDGTIYLFDVVSGGGAVPPLGNANPLNADRIGYFRSAAGGGSWSWTTIALDGQSVLPDRPNEHYLFENFGQLDACVGGDGTIHVVVNGYGFDYGRPDSAEIFRVLYWNSTLGSWRHLDRDTLNRPPYLVPQFRSGNAIGRPYPTISYDPRSRHVRAVWAEPQANATAPDTSNGVYMYDLWTAHCSDGGFTWLPPWNVTNSPNGSELFPTLSREMTGAGADSSRNRSHLVFLYESRADNGCWLFGEGPRSLSPWMYRWIEHTITSLGGSPSVLSGFSLEQNYPNPFNGSTRISITLPRAAHVSLVVYDVLGRVVETLIDETKEAGYHTVQWNAAGRSSGVYLARFTATTAGARVGLQQTMKLVLTK